MHFHQCHWHRFWHMHRSDQNIRIVTQHNIFKFGDTYWIQLNGTTMVTPPVPVYAYMNSCSYTLSYKFCITHGTLMFFIWNPDTPQKLRVPRTKCHKTHRIGLNLSWNFAAHAKCVSFLDLLITITPEGDLGPIIYKKTSMCTSTFHHTLATLTRDHLILSQGLCIQSLHPLHNRLLLQWISPMMLQTFASTRSPSKSHSLCFRSRNEKPTVNYKPLLSSIATLQWKNHLPSCDLSQPRPATKQDTETLQANHFKQTAHYRSTKPPWRHTTAQVNNLI